MIVVLVIFIMIPAVVYRFVLENVKKEIEASNLMLVEHAAESVDARLKELDVYSHRMTSDSKFSKRNLGKSAYDNYECVPEMKKYKAINNFMDDVGVFYSDIPEKIFCESGIAYMKSGGALTGNVDNIRKFNPDEMDVEDFACGNLKFSGGANISFKVAWAANMPESSDIRLVGDKAGIDLTCGKIYFGEDGEEKLEMKKLKYDAPFAGHMYTADNLRKLLKGIEEPFVKPEETMNAARIIELFYKSAELGREVFADEKFNK